MRCCQRDCASARTARAVSCSSSAAPRPLMRSRRALARADSQQLRCAHEFSSSTGHGLGGHAWDQGHGHASNGHWTPHMDNNVATLDLPSAGAAALNKTFQTFDDEEPGSSVFPHTPRADHALPNAHAEKPKLKYETIMLKVSGEALQGSLGFGVDATVMRAVAEEVKRLVEAGVKVAIVVGGGNYFRGANAWQGLERATADYVGMLATVMNALQLQGALEALSVDTRVQTAIEMREVAEPYIRRRAVAHLNAGRVVIFGAGTGNPFFTTDTAAALRAAEINAQVFIKATKVDGIYDSDPEKNPLAKKYNKLSYRQCTDESLRVMDATAITLCQENNIPVLVLNMLEQGNILKAVLGEDIGTVVCDGCDL